MYKKIDIFLKGRKNKIGLIQWGGFWVYETSTNAARTCKEAKETFALDTA